MMTDVTEIINYIKTLRKGFDKDLFISKIDELTYIVDTTGLVYDDFQTLFKVWLNLSIPVMKWVSLGQCLVPSDIVEERTVYYALRWILANFQTEQNVPRVAFLLGWLTVAMECESIDMAALDSGYEVFFTLLSYEALTVHAMKLVYTLTKPIDVTRRRALELMDYAKKRESKKNLYRQLQVLLGLFKSYKPECVPEDIPAFSIHTAFKKPNEHVFKKFNKLQVHRNKYCKKNDHLQWNNPINSGLVRKKKVDPLVPNVEFNKRSRLFDSSNGQELTKTFLDFSDSVSLVHYSLHHVMSRPTRIRAMLCNAMGQTQLAIMSNSLQVFLSHDLHHLLNYCSFELSPCTYAEKEDFLQRLAVFQRTLAQGIPVVTRFLAQYLPLWNEKDYFPEILELAQWVSVECGRHVQHVAAGLAAAHSRAEPARQCAILRTLTCMYTNLVYASTKPRQHFLNTMSSSTSYSSILPELSRTITIMCHKAIQVDPDDMRILYTTIWSAQRRAIAELNYSLSIVALPTLLTFAMPLLGISPVLIDSMAELMILWKNNISVNKTQNSEHIHILGKYMSDLLSCLYSEEALSRREEGLVFEKINPQLIDKLGCIVPDVNTKLSIRNHIAFATLTYIPVVDKCGYNEYYNKQEVNKDLYPIINQVYTSLGLFLKKSLTRLGYM